MSLTVLRRSAPQIWSTQRVLWLLLPGWRYPSYCRSGSVSMCFTGEKNECVCSPLFRGFCLSALSRPLARGLVIYFHERHQEPSDTVVFSVTARCAWRRRVGNALATALNDLMGDFHRAQAVIAGRQLCRFSTNRPWKCLEFPNEALNANPSIRAKMLHDVCDGEKVVFSTDSTTALSEPYHLRIHRETSSADAATRSVNLHLKTVASPLRPARLKRGHLATRIAEESQPVVLTSLEPPDRIGRKPFNLHDFA